MIFSKPQTVSRLPLAILAVCLQFAAAWLFIHQLHGHSVTIFHTIDLVPVEQHETMRVKPPEPVLKRVELPPAPVIPIFNSAPDRGDNGGITVAPVQPNTGNTAVPVGETRAPQGIVATHTVPPYPAIARRLGAEGKVMLRLTVSTQGRVAQADIVTSSGRRDLDEAAQQWIMTHWTYRPALHDGAPASGQVLATVTFSLTNTP
jgi:TonB family protein